MSLLAIANTVPISALAELDRVAEPRKRFFGGVSDDFPATLRRVSRNELKFAASGSILATLLPFLEDHGIGLLKSEYDTFADRWSAVRQATFIVLTNDHKVASLEALEGATFDLQALRTYYESFNEVTAPGVEQPMVEGVQFLAAVLRSVSENSVGVLGIG